MQEKIQRIITGALKNLSIPECDFAVEHPDDLKNGDYFTNVALISGKVAGGNPKEIAQKIVGEIEKNLPQKIVKMEVAGPGFINFFLSREFFSSEMEDILNQGEGLAKNNILSGQKIIIDYTDPNPFKPFHIGHLMTNAIGESIARIMEHSGAQVFRANYQGDVGLHVAKSIYGLLKNPELAVRTGSHNTEAANIGRAYVFGAGVYETDLAAKKEIDEINQKIYKRSDEKINEIYDWGFKATMAAFEDFKITSGTGSNFNFMESMMAPIGEEVVRANLGTVFEES